MIITRFAPSPTGRLHLGHAYAALFAYRNDKQALTASADCLQAGLWSSAFGVGGEKKADRRDPGVYLKGFILNPCMPNAKRSTPL